ncbi:pistil-specific extensin-like protein [Momordica charantia]|uniref:Pistil-specific extensin-like protein n=1 Tax=Momordica charantia TaxID=3673 RepID=A0A6J1CSG0_MOMCH|nr:pistil-specific extensin-like protein [Momordica charantia]
MAPLLRLIMAASVLIACTNIVAAADDAGVIHIGGKVLCQDCTQGWNEWINGKPLKDCKVSVTCLDERSRVMHYASDLTDELGQFDITIDKLVHGKKLNPKKCSVRLVSSPDPTCNIMTDFAGGRSGVQLRGPSLTYRDFVKYVLGPFYFTSPMCEEPNTDDSDDNNGKNY